MESPLPALDKHSPIRSVDDLLSPLHDACKPRSAFRIGTEAEKIGIDARSFQPVPFEGERGVATILDLLAKRFGWQPNRESADGPLIALTRGAASITLEPGAQLELSGAPLRTIHETAAEFANHIEEVRSICDPLDIAWLGLGFHPLARLDQLPWVPKSRYPVMRGYLPTRGLRAHDMMQRTCTVQANLDFSSEEDACRKLRVSLALQPIVTAMFANSPWVEGRRGPHLSERASVWLEMDPERSGLLPFAWNDDLSFLRYVEWALDVPMFVVKRDGRVLPNTGQTFRQFMEDGLAGLDATLGDWETHLNTLFPEARLKRIIEVRGADSQTGELVCALPALWKGLLYDDAALTGVEALVGPLRHDEVSAARPEIARVGLRASLGGRPVGEWANELVGLAVAGLQRIGDLNELGQDESIHLQAVAKLVGEGRTPAEVMLERVNGASSLPEALLAHARA